ncbi:MAG: DUF6179 domain-containing protein [Eubacteriaceae bacterium]|nr:DUF6179 domain-containing protein [Eubacteriaceae bacterium]
MSDSLQRSSKIDISTLNGSNYFSSLLEQAYIKGLVSDFEIERMQNECLMLLADKATMHNSGDSSSILEEEASEFMASIMFTIGVWLKAFQNPDDALGALMEPLKSIYQKGQTKVSELVISAKQIHEKLLLDLLETNNVHYRSTFIDEISEFFDIYDQSFFAHEIHDCTEYPLFNPIGDLAGIEYIQAYMQAAYLENSFCLLFSPDDIHTLMASHDKGYGQLLTNIFGPVLSTAVGCLIAGTNMEKLELSKQAIEYLQTKIARMEGSQVFETVNKAILELSTRFGFNDELFGYIKACAFVLTEQIILWSTGAGNSVFVETVGKSETPTLFFNAGEKMDSVEYTKLVDEISNIDSTMEKLNLINTKVHSLGDLQDVLIDGWLTSEEIHLALSNLGMLEIAALTKKWLNEDFSDLSDSEMLFVESLHSLVFHLPEEQQNAIKLAGEAIGEEWQ